MKKFWLVFMFALPLALFATHAGAADLPKLDKSRTALLITDPQNDFLRKDGKLFGLLEGNLKRLNTIDHIALLMKVSKARGVQLAVDPLVYTQLDKGWTHAGTLQRQLLDMQALHRTRLGEPKGFEDSGADFFKPYKTYIQDGETIVAAPHKVYGPESNDLIYQLRSRGIDTVILGGMVANLCVDSHMRALMENGFKVYVVKDAVAAPGEEAYQAALVNFGMIANGVWTTAQAVEAMSN